jgi:hypothetical protein
MTCAYCSEEIRPGEAHPDLLDHHFECLMRAVAGSAAHQLGECTCFGGTREDPPSMTTRQAAALAWDTYRVLHGKT